MAEAIRYDTTAGEYADIIARVLAEEMSKTLGQSIVTEAKPGAGGNIASDAVAKAASGKASSIAFPSSRMGKAS